MLPPKRLADLKKRSIINYAEDKNKNFDDTGEAHVACTKFV